MPLALDTNQIYRFVLASDKLKPEQEQPTFLLRFVAKRDWKRIEELLLKSIELDATKNLDDSQTKITEAFKIALVGWERMGGVAFDPANLDGLLTYIECWEIRERLLEELAVAEGDLKKSVRQSLLDTAKSVSEPKAVAAAQP